jgi:hypothetical protein
MTSKHVNTPDQLSTEGARKVSLVIRARFTFCRHNAMVCMLVFIVVVGSHVPTFWLTVNQPTQPDSDASGNSDQVYASDTTLMRGHGAPTHFRLMTSRYVAMVQAVRGHHCTELSLFCIPPSNCSESAIYQNGKDQPLPKPFSTLHRKV